LQKPSKQQNHKVIVSPEVRFTKLSAAQKKIDVPMIVLSFVWLCVLIAELVSEPNRLLHVVGSILWGVFVLYFVMRLLIVSSRWLFLKKNWLFLTAILFSVLRFFPILQPFPFVRVITATFGMQVIWIFASADQGMRSIRRKLGRRGVGYGLAFTAIVMFAGAAGMLHFEQLSNDPDRIQNYPRALWWTAMQMTNIGSAYYLKTEGGRVICLAISVYAAAMFGYLTALFASFIIDRETKIPKAEIAREKQLVDMQVEIKRLGDRENKAHFYA
jgi:voltage-gated potassium channel